jgi:microcystin-dependent protein
MDPFLGQIQPFAFGITPKGWAACNGQLLPINQNQALFSLLGTTYGGNGQTTFALPDLRGRVSAGQGAGPGLTPAAIGQQMGTETVTLTSNQMPAHSHSISGSTGAANAENPLNAVLALQAWNTTGPNLATSPANVLPVGNNQAQYRRDRCSRQSRDRNNDLE